VVVVVVVVVVAAMVVVVIVDVLASMVVVIVLVVTVVETPSACGHKRKPLFPIDPSEIHVIDFEGTVPLGPRLPLYATPLTMRLSYIASVSKFLTTIGVANVSLILMVQYCLFSYAKGKFGLRKHWLESMLQGPLVTCHIRPGWSIDDVVVDMIVVVSVVVDGDADVEHEVPLQGHSRPQSCRPQRHQSTNLV
jgi:hypothetical protein